jgi:hypothetical protein
VRAGVGAGNPARQLLRVLRGVAKKGENRTRLIRMLFDHHRKIDAPPIEPRRRAGLESPDRQVQLAQPCRQRNRRWITHASANHVRHADVDQAVEKSAGGQDHGSRRKAYAELGHHPGHPIAVDDQIVTGLRENRQLWLILQATANRLPVEDTISLRARRTHRRTFARIQRTKLDTRLIGRLGHRPSQGVDLFDQMPFANAADRRIAAHRTQGIEVVRQQQGLHSHARRSQRRLGAGMAAANDNHLETVRKEHGQSDLPRTEACAKERNSTAVG